MVESGQFGGLRIWNKKLKKWLLWGTGMIWRKFSICSRKNNPIQPCKIHLFFPYIFGGQIFFDWVLTIWEPYCAPGHLIVASARAPLGAGESQLEQIGAQKWTPGKNLTNFDYWTIPVAQRTWKLYYMTYLGPTQSCLLILMLMSKNSVQLLSSCSFSPAPILLLLISCSFSPAPLMLPPCSSSIFFLDPPSFPFAPHVLTPSFSTINWEVQKHSFELDTKASLTPVLHLL